MYVDEGRDTGSVGDTGTMNLAGSLIFYDCGPPDFAACGGNLYSGTIRLDGGSISTEFGLRVHSLGVITGNGLISDGFINYGTIRPLGTIFAGFAAMQASGIFDEPILGPGNSGELLAGGASLDGTLNIQLLNGYTPAIGSRFYFIDSPSVTGAFAKIDGLAINSNEEFQVLYNPTNVELCVVSTSNPVCGAPAPVPEPRGIVLLGTAVSGALWYRRRRTHNCGGMEHGNTEMQ